MRSSIKGIIPEWYTLEGEEGKPDPVQFELKSLDGFESMEIATLSLMAQNPGASMTDVGQISSNIVKRAFQLGVKSWRNIEDKNNPGKMLPFSMGSMASIWPHWIMEVGARVLAISEISEAAAKNSDSPSSSP